MNDVATQTALAALPPLHLPAPVSAWPPAPGWWLLAIVAVAAVIAGLWYWRRRRRRLALVNLAAEESVNNLERYRQSRDAADYLYACNALLKRFVLQQFPGRGLAPLCGKAWLRELDGLVSTQTFDGPIGRQLLAVYEPRIAVDVDELHKLIQGWLQTLRRTL